MLHQRMHLLRGIRNYPVLPRRLLAGLVRLGAASAGAVPVDRGEAAGAGRFDVGGTQAVKGITREVTVPVTLAYGPAAGQGTASGSFTLRRMDIKLGEDEWADTGGVANEVVVRFRLQLAGLPPP